MRLQAPTSGVVGASSKFLAFCFATDAIGDAVYIMGNKVGDRYQVTKVDIDDPAKWKSIGIIVYKSSASECVVQCGGLVYGVYTGLTPDAWLFVDTNSRLIEGPPARPTAGLRATQNMGVVLSTTDLLLHVKSPIILRA
jgi:hypothetical protein